MFAGAARSTIERLAELSTTRAYAKGALIFNLSEPADSLYLVHSGRVRLFLLAPEGAELTLAYAGPGACFGELAALDNGVRSAAASADRPTVLLRLSADALHHRLATDADLARTMLVAVASLARRSVAQMADLAFLGLEARVALSLLDAPAHNAASALDLSQGELAHLAGGARQTVNRVLQRFVQQELITIRNRRVEVLDVEGLQRLARGVL